MNRDRKYWNEEMETILADKLHDLHNKKFLSHMDYVFSKSEFYKEKFKAAGISRGDIQSVDDIDKLPFTEKQELRDSQLTKAPLGKHMACESGDIVRFYSSSGTTGVPTYIGLTQNDIDGWIEIGCRYGWSCGFRPDDIIAMAVGAGGYFAAAGLQGALEHLGATVVPIGPGATERILAAFQNLKANAMFGTPSYAVYFLDWLKKKEIDPKSLGCKKIIVGGEPGGSDPYIRKKVQEGFGCKFSEGMGLGEVAVAVWSECYKQDGMHFAGQGLVHVEIIDPETLKPIKDLKTGTNGELVYSSLFRECMPLIRYRTRDQVIINMDPCECGRTGMRIKCVGRTDDMLLILGVNVYPAAIRDVIGTFQPKVSGMLEIQLDKPGPKVEPPLKIKVEHAKGVGDLKALKKELEAGIREKLVFRADVELVPDGSLPRYEYKGKLVRKLYEE